MSNPPPAASPKEGLTLPAAALSEEATLAPEPVADAAAGRITAPGYEVLEEMGRGGMGVVYKARHVALNRVVALKVILHGTHAGEAVFERFRTEAEAVARLQHPNIVQVFEVGEHEGLPFICLEHCPGGSLEKKLAGTPLPPGEAAALVEQLARAVQAAHDANVLHRDLKPANVLLTTDGTPKLTDFGLARKLDQASVTQTGVVMGTPSYMSPEQAEGKKAIGPAADVYSLGAILYECLTGRPPFKAATTLDTILQVVGEEPVPPRQLNAKVPRDLETITLKCLQKAPQRRYTSAAQLADDLRRFVAGEPIVARPVGALGRAAKWARRRPAVAALLGVIALALGAMVTGGVLFTLSLDAARERAERGEADALEQKGLAELFALSLDAARERAERGEALAGERLKLARLTAYNIQLLGAATLVEKEPAQALALLRDKELCPEDLRDFTRGLLVRRCLGGEVRTLKQPGPVDLMAASADGRVLAVAGLAGRWRGGARSWGVAVWDVGDERLARVVRVGVRYVQAIAVHPKGTHLAYSGDGATVRLVDLATGREADLPLHPKRGGKVSADAVAFSPDGKTLAVGLGSRDEKAGLRSWGEVWLWDVASRRYVGELPGLGNPVRLLAFSPDGKSLAVAHATNSASIWSLGDRTPRARLSFKPYTPSALTYTPDGRSLVAELYTGVTYFDPDTGKPQRSSDILGLYNASLTFSPDSQRFAITNNRGLSQHLAIHDTATGEVRQALAPPSPGWVKALTYLGNDLLASGGRDAVCLHRLVPMPTLLHDARDWGNAQFPDDHLTRPGVAFSPDGNWLAAGSTTVPLGPGGAGKGNRSLAWLVTFGRLAYSPDGRRLAAAVSNDVRIYAPPGSEVRSALKGHEHPVTCLAWCPDGSLISGGSDGTVRRWDLKTGRHSVLLRVTGKVLLFSPDRVMRWTFPEAAYTRRSLISQLAVSPDGKTLAVSLRQLGEKGDETNRVQLWDLEKGKELRSLPTGYQAIRALAFHPAGHVLAVGAYGPIGSQGNSSLFLYPLATAGEGLAMRGEQGEVTAVAFSPDGRTLASAHGREGGAVKLWCATTGQQRGIFRGPEGKLYDLAFSRDSRRLAVAAEAGGRYQFYLWQADP